MGTLARAMGPAAALADAGVAGRAARAGCAAVQVAGVGPGWSGEGCRGPRGTRAGANGGRPVARVLGGRAWSGRDVRWRRAVPGGSGWGGFGRGRRRRL